MTDKDMNQQVCVRVNGGEVPGSSAYTMPASNQVGNHAVASCGGHAVTVMGSGISAQSSGAMVQEHIDCWTDMFLDQSLSQTTSALVQNIFS